MPVYTFNGRTQAGRVISGEFKAKNMDRAIAELQKRGIEVVEIRPKKKPLLGRSISFLRRVRMRDITVFARQFATMVAAGIPIVQCLEILAEQTENKHFKEIVVSLKKDVETGSTLAEAMDKKRNVFGDFMVSMVAVGEAGGILSETLARVANYLEKVSSLRRKIKTAMAYPSIIFIISILVTTMLLIFLIPTFMKMYESSNIQVPGPTRMVANFSLFLRHNFLWIAIGLFAFYFAIRKIKKTRKGKLIFDTLFLKVPLFGDLMRKASISRFARTLGILVRSGVPILDSLDITADTSGNAVIEKALRESRKSIGEGKSIAQPLKESGVFPPLVIHLVSVGEQTGKLSDMLDKVATFYEEEVDAKVDALSSILEPIMLVFVGAIVGTILLAMYLPIFNIASTVK